MNKWNPTESAKDAMKSKEPAFQINGVKERRGLFDGGELFDERGDGSQLPNDQVSLSCLDE